MTQTTSTENPTTVLINNWPNSFLSGEDYVVESKSVVDVAATDAHIEVTKLLTSYYEKKFNKGMLGDASRQTTIHEEQY